MKKQINLSKSKLLAYRQCEKRLWLEVKHPELREDSSITQMGFKVGNHVGELAQEIYDPNNEGTLINPQEEGFKSAFARTAKLIKKRKPIFEATFTSDGALSLADVMLPANKSGKLKWDMIEVKSSTKVKDYHLDDVAIQAFIAKQSGVDVKTIKLAFIDNKWVYPGGNNYQDLLKEEDLTAEAFSRENEVKSWIEQAQKVTRKTKEPKIGIGSHCDQPYTCGFYEYCSKDEAQAEFPVQWLPRIQAKKLKSKIVIMKLLNYVTFPMSFLINYNSALNSTHFRAKLTLINKVLKMT